MHHCTRCRRRAAAAAAAALDSNERLAPAVNEGAAALWFDLDAHVSIVVVRPSVAHSKMVFGFSQC